MNTTLLDSAVQAPIDMPHDMADTFFPPATDELSMVEAPSEVAEDTTRRARFNDVAHSALSVGEVIPVAESAEHKEELTQDEQCYMDIASDPFVTMLPEGERKEAIDKAYELYKIAKEHVAPVITSFAEYLLREADNKQIVFAGRDGLGAFKAAQILKDKFYGGDTDNQLIYAYLTRRIVLGTPKETLAAYLHQVGLKSTDDSVVMADIGMYGSIVSKIQSILPHVDTRYLISKSHSIPGFASEHGRDMASMSHIVGNPAVHFLEDTFSGLVASPSSLVEVNGQLQPVSEGFAPVESLQRRYALRAIEDYAKSLNALPPQNADQHIKDFDTFLSNPAAYKHVMVPHQR